MRPILNRDLTQRSCADQFMHHLKSKNDIIGLDAIAAAGRQSKSYQQTQRIKRRSGQCGTRRFSGPSLLQMGKRRRLHRQTVLMDDYTSVNTAGVHGRSFEHPNSRGKDKAKGKELGEEKKEE